MVFQKRSKLLPFDVHFFWLKNCKTAQVRAADLRVGDEVLVNGIATKLTSLDVVPGEVTVLKIVFHPDLAVGAFDFSECIYSHGNRQRRIRRGRHPPRASDGVESIAGTEGDYQD